MTRDERRILGEQATFLLENDAYKAAMDRCLLLLQMRWANSEPDDPQGRETLFHQFQAVHAIEEMLKNFCEDGTRAEREKDGDETGRD